MATAFTPNVGWTLTVKPSVASPLRCFQFVDLVNNSGISYPPSRLFVSGQIPGGRRLGQRLWTLGGSGKVVKASGAGVEGGRAGDGEFTEAGLWGAGEPLFSLLTYSVPSGLEKD